MIGARATLVAALVAAAVSLKAPLEDASKQFTDAALGEAIQFNFGSSGTLAAQIEQGAPIDLFVSASPVDMDRLAKAGKLVDATRVPLAGNTLVVVIHKGIKPPATLADLAAPRFARIAIGNPETVPAGRYAHDSIVAAGLSDKLDSRLAFSENVRGVLDLIARGEAEAGFVYATDVSLGGDRVAKALDVDDKLHAPIVYEGAVVRDAHSAARAKAFLDFLSTPAGRKTLTDRGFKSAPEPSPH